MLNENIAVEIKDGRIFIDEQDQGFERDDQEHMRLTARALQKGHTVHMLDEKRLEDRRLFGIGTIEGNLGLVGQTHTVERIEVIIQAAPADRTDLDWHSYIGASLADGEFDDEDRWAVHVRVPGDVWKRLEFDYDAGQVREIDLTVVAPLWCKPTPFFHQRRPDLKLTPDRNGGGGATQGKTTSITWRDRPATVTDPVVGPTLAGDDDEPVVAGPGPSMVIPARLVSIVSWCLPAIVVLLAFIASRS
ncbi:hypothetical protein SAMN05428997_10533 [Bosea sp. CRIB-10]|uniref:hypothetical protein n=1 Tax=Bosea sp. CRIB-10 TaxID=378404 RepID=UPI0008F07ADB|nr:hypothetical protein [Bosea sp. CRIB-10]SFC22821.1 hypothetical protein SAMN05428997_10533 [Bosea sp. CRIB-10]